MTQNKRQLKISELYAAHPPKFFDWNGKRPSIEDTGKGDLLCFENWGGRLFRSNEDSVRKAVDKFVNDYTTGCRRSEEDPAHVYTEVYNFNDLYQLLGILPTTFGEAFGYTTSEYYVQNVRFRVEFIYPSKNFIAEQFGEPILLIEPADDESYPQYYYKEV